MEKEIGKVIHYFDKISVAVVALSGGLKVGDKIKIKGGGAEFEQIVESMQIDRKPIEKAKKGEEVGMSVAQKAGRNFRVCKIS